MRISDWSSDVCSSDLRPVKPQDQADDGGFARSHLAEDGCLPPSLDDERHIVQRAPGLAGIGENDVAEPAFAIEIGTPEIAPRSEERREGTEGVSTGGTRWSRST